MKLTPPYTKLWTFPSNSRPGLEHTVTYSNGKLYCTCESFKYRGHCKHVEAACGIEPDVEILAIRPVDNVQRDDV